MSDQSYDIVVIPALLGLDPPALDIMRRMTIDCAGGSANVVIRYVTSLLALGGRGMDEHCKLFNKVHFIPKD